MEDCESVQGDRDEKTKEETLVRLCGRGNMISKRKYHFPEGKPAMHFLYMETYGDGASSPSQRAASRGGSAPYPQMTEAAAAKIL